MFISSIRCFSPPSLTYDNCFPNHQQAENLRGRVTLMPAVGYCLV